MASREWFGLMAFAKKLGVLVGSKPAPFPEGGKGCGTHPRGGFPLREGHCAGRPLVPELPHTGKHLGVLRCLSSRADVVGGSCPTGNCSLTGGREPPHGGKEAGRPCPIGLAPYLGDETSPSL
jgi:hypothetical protein